MDASGRIAVQQNHTQTSLEERFHKNPSSGRCSNLDADRPNNLHSYFSIRAHHAVGNEAARRRLLDAAPTMMGLGTLGVGISLHKLRHGSEM